MRLPRVRLRPLMIAAAVAAIIGGLIFQTRRAAEADRLAETDRLAGAAAQKQARTLEDRVRRLEAELRDLAARREMERMSWEATAQLLQWQVSRAREALHRGSARGKPDQAGAIRIARRDANTFYGELTEHQKIEASLDHDGWHVDIVDTRPLLTGGGLHYLIDPETGRIKSVGVAQ